MPYAVSGQAETIINILIDVSGFLAYENRELQIDAKDVKDVKEAKDEMQKTEPPPHPTDTPEMSAEMSDGLQL